MQILDIVKFNNSIALVVDDIPTLTYEKRGKYLIGSDNNGILFDCLYYMRDSMFKAFAGREFDLQMKDGSIIRCDGQYWSGKTKECGEELGIELCDVTLQSKQKLQDCYVFTRFSVNKEKYI